MSETARYSRWEKGTRNYALHLAPDLFGRRGVMPRLGLPE